MRVQVCGAYGSAPRSTISLSKSVRNRITAAHGAPVRPGYAVQVTGDSRHCPRNPIVQVMRKEDKLLRKKAVARFDPRTRKRLGLEIGDVADIRPLKYETWYHGTGAPDPKQNIVRGRWLVGGSGRGVWMSDQLTMAQGYARTGLLTLEVAWGDELAWPLPAHMQEQFELWCAEHRVDASSVGPANWQASEHVLRWARLFGHYFVPFANARIFPGVTGQSFKGNRVRIVKLVDREGNELYVRRSRFG